MEAPRRAAATSEAETGVPRIRVASLEVLFTMRSFDLKSVHFYWKTFKSISIASFCIWALLEKSIYLFCALLIIMV